MKRAVLYLRVSTLDQTTANQERELREIVNAAAMMHRPAEAKIHQ
jgi:DNA invertase Pin-like site-specific DNA recombinase